MRNLESDYIKEDSRILKQLQPRKNEYSQAKQTERMYQKQAKMVRTFEKMAAYNLTSSISNLQKPKRKSRKARRGVNRRRMNMLQTEPMEVLE